jgi:hypothetical protein
MMAEMQAETCSEVACLVEARCDVVAKEGLLYFIPLKWKEFTTKEEQIITRG